MLLSTIFTLINAIWPLAVAQFPHEFQTVSLDAFEIRAANCDEGFQRIIYSDSHELFSTCLTSLPNGNLLLCGAMDDESLFVEVDEEGIVQWAGTLDMLSGPEIIIAADLDQDGNVLCQGQFRIASRDTYVIKYDPTLRKVIWVMVPDIPDVVIWDMIDPGGSDPYVALGVRKTSPNPGSGDDAVYRRIDRNTGQVLAGDARNMHLGSAEDFQAGVMVNGDIFTVGRYVTTSAFSDMRISVSRIGPGGNEVWSRMTARPIFEDARMYGHDITARDEVIYFTGNGDPDGTSITNTLSYLGKIDTDGNLLWMKEYNFPAATAQLLADIVPTSEGLLIYARGWLSSGLRGYIHVDTSGNILSKGTLGNQGDDFRILRYTHSLALRGDQFFNVFTTSAHTNRSAFAFSRHPLSGTPAGCVSFDSFEVEVREISNPDNSGVNLVEYASSFPFKVSNPDVQTTSVLGTVFCECDTIPELELMIMPIQVHCHGDSTGALSITVVAGEVPLTYMWEQLDGVLSGSDSIMDLGQDEVIDNLPRGSYVITITDQLGNTSILESMVTDPPPVEGSLEVSDYRGFNISCAGLADGMITVTATGGTGQLALLWSTGDTTELIDGLVAGGYSVTITDELGCTAELTTSLTEPEPLVLEAFGSGPGCESPESGGIEIISVSGGVGPYEYQLDGGPFQNTTEFEQLSEGEYAVTVRDGNDCVTDTVLTLQGAKIPELTLINDLTVEAGDSVELAVLQTFNVDSILWQPPVGLDCTNCEEPLATPETTITYYVSVFSSDGCQATDSVTIRVLSPCDFYIPNVFSPNNDGINDRLFVSGNYEMIQELNIYSRWGEHLVRETNVLSTESRGWDGTFRGQNMPAGVYTWYMIVQCQEGIVEKHSGDLTLVR